MSRDAPDHLYRWSRWIHDHGWKLLAHARQFCRLTHEAEDLVQEVMTELWEKHGHHPPPDLSFVLTRIRQRAIDGLRSSRSRDRREESWQNEQSTQEILPPDSPSDLEHDRRRVQIALDQLPLIFREVVSLKLWSDLTFEEIADLLSIPKNTAASRYRLALDKLRPLLSPLE